jgi:hypothetical protein
MKIETFLFNDSYMFSYEPILLTQVGYYRVKLIVLLYREFFILL